MAAVEAAGGGGGGGTHNYNSIALGGRGGVSQGRLTISPAGFVWRKASGGNAVEIKKEDIAALTWTPVGPRGCQLGVQVRAGAAAGSTAAGANFLGFRDSDLESLRGYCSSVLGTPLVQREMATAGRNWGEIELHGGALAFMADAPGATASAPPVRKVAFELPLSDVAQAQHVKDEVALEFHVDDTTTGDREDVLVEAVFVVPPASKAWQPAEAADDADGAAAADGNDKKAPAGADGGEADKPPPARPAKVLLDALLPLTDAVGAGGAGGAADEPITTFEGVAVLQPRGRFDIEMYGSYLRLAGQTQEFKIRYASVPRVAVLPNPRTPHTLVVLALDPPIRKGQTYYSFLVTQWPSADTADVRLADHFTDEAIAAKNEKCNQVLGKGNILQREHTGAAPDVFARLLRGLAAARLSKPNAKDGFRDASRQGFAVRCGYKAEDGYLYPLTGAFFFVHKPPLQLPYEDVEGVEFARQQAGAGLLSGAARTFDLAIRMRGGQEHQFRGIQRTEWQGLFDWIQGRGIHIENVDSARRGPGGGAAAAGGFALGDDEDGDLGGGRGGGGDGEESSEDSDFEGGSSDASESSSGGSGSGSGSGSDSDAEMVDEEGVKATAIKKKKAAAGGGKKAAAGKKRGAGGSSDEGGDGSPATSPAAKKKKKRAKKDPNAPKKAISAFFYFGAAKREEIKREQPGITIGEVGKKLGELWRAATADEKKPFDEMAERDKERYAREMEAWKAKGAAGGGGASSEEGEEGEKTGGKDEEMGEAGAKEEEDGGKAAAASGGGGGDE